MWVENGCGGVPIGELGTSRELASSPWQLRRCFRILPVVVTGRISLEASLTKSRGFHSAAGGFRGSPMPHRVISRRLPWTPARLFPIGLTCDLFRTLSRLIGPSGLALA